MTGQPASQTSGIQSRILKAERVATPEEDVIYVTLEAESIRQLIRLSQNLITSDQIEAEIERDRST